MRRLIFGLGLGVTVLMVLLTAFPPLIVERARDAVFDGYQRAAPRPYDPSSPVHIITIDEAALAQFGQWPWPRSYVAELTDRLFAHGAVVVGFDIIFAEPDRTAPAQLAQSVARFSGQQAPDLAALGLPDPDAGLVASVQGRPVVLAISGTAAPTADPPAPPPAGVAVTGALPPGLTRYPAAVTNLAPLTAVASGIGTVSLGQSGDGVTRTVPMVSDLGGVQVAALSAELLRVAQGAGGHILKTTEGSGQISGVTIAATAMQVGALNFPLEADGRFRVHFAGHQPGRVTSAVEVLSAEGIDPDLQERLAGRIVLVGAAAQGLFDIRATPLSTQVPGVELHAEIIEQIVSGRFLTRPDWMRGLEIVIVALTGLSLTALARFERPVLGLCLALALGVGALVAGRWAFQEAGLLYSPLMASLTAALVYLPATTLGFIAKDRARRAIRARFARFLPPSLIAEIEKNPARALTPEGAERDLTVIFVDMRGFSTTTEGMAPDRVVVLVNSFLSTIAEALVAHGATIDKFMGDAVMAFWNAPIPRDDHARAALGALPALDAAAERVNFDLAALGLPRINLGIGINSGPASVGLMGSKDRLSYTCVGDSVTLAARLEGLTRLYGTRNCVGPVSALACPDDLRAVALDLIAVKGFAQAVEVSTILPRGAPGVADFASAIGDARAAFTARDWDRAETLFAALPSIKPPFCNTARLAQLYLDRIATLRADPPPKGWQGESAAQAKR